MKGNQPEKKNSPQDKQLLPPPLLPYRLPKLLWEVPWLVWDPVDSSQDRIPAPAMAPLSSRRREDIVTQLGRSPSLSVLGISCHHVLDDTIAILKEVYTRRVYLYNDDLFKLYQRMV